MAQKTGVKKFGDKYGLDPERFDLQEGIKFVLKKVSVRQSFQKGIKDEYYDVALLDGVDLTGKPVKYYSSSRGITGQCKQIIKDGVSPDGTMPEPLEVVTVLKEPQETGKKPYVAFE